MEQRAISLAEKPYMDPKGWILIASTRWKSAKELRELAAMHRSEGQRLLALEKNEEVPTKDLEKKGNASQERDS